MLTKTDLDDEDKIYEKLKKAVREIKSSITCNADIEKKREVLYSDRYRRSQS